MGKNSWGRSKKGPKAQVSIIFFASMDRPSQLPVTAMWLPESRGKWRSPRLCLSVYGLWLLIWLLSGWNDPWQVHLQALLAKGTHGTGPPAAHLLQGSLDPDPVASEQRTQGRSSSSHCGSAWPPCPQCVGGATCSTWGQGPKLPSGFTLHWGPQQAATDLWEMT